MRKPHEETKTRCTQRPKPVPLVYRRDHLELNRAPHVIARDEGCACGYSKAEYSRRQIHIKGFPACPRIGPILIVAFEDIPESHALRSEKGEAGITESQVFFPGSQAVNGTWPGMLAANRHVLNQDWWRRILADAPVRLISNEPFERSEPQFSVASLDGPGLNS